MSYYILTNQIENEQEDAVIEGYYEHSYNNEYDFECGYSYVNQGVDSPIIFNFYKENYRGEMNDHLSIDDIHALVISLRTKIFFEKHNFSNIEYYQLLLLDKFYCIRKEDENKDNVETKIDKLDDEEKIVMEYRNYFIANILGLVDCVDHEKSVLEYFFPPELKSQEKVQINKQNDNIINPFADENPNEIDFITKLVLDESKINSELKIFRLKDKPDLLIFDESVVNLIRKEELSGFVFVPVEEYTDSIPDDEESNDIKESEQEQVFTKLKQKENTKELEQSKKSKDAKKRRFFFE